MGWEEGRQPALYDVRVTVEGRHHGRSDCFSSEVFVVFELIVFEVCFVVSEAVVTDARGSCGIIVFELLSVVSDAIACGALDVGECCAIGALDVGTSFASDACEAVVNLIFFELFEFFEFFAVVSCAVGPTLSTTVTILMMH